MEESEAEAVDEVETTTKAVSEVGKMIDSGVSSSDLSEQLGNLVLVFSYSLIVIVSLFGNIFVCRVMLGLSNSRTTTNVLIFNLAVSDLLLTTFNIPVNIVRFVTRNWPFGETICAMTPFIQSLSAHCSSITMMVIAFERYRSLIGISQTLRTCGYAIKRLCYCECNSSGNSSSHLAASDVPRRSVPSRRAWIRLVTMIWLCSAILSIPHSLYNKVISYEMVGIRRCATTYPTDQARIVLAVLSPTSQYLLPIGFTVLFYARIGHFLWRRADPVGVVSEGRRLSILRRKRKRVKMLVVVVLFFAICWLPLHLYVTLIDFRVIQPHFGIFFITHWIAMSSVCYNPFIYCWMNETFRRKTDTLFQLFSSLKNCWGGSQGSSRKHGDSSSTEAGSEVSIQKMSTSLTTCTSSGRGQSSVCRVVITQDLATNYELEENETN